MATELERHPGGRPREYDRWALLPRLKEVFAIGMSNARAADLVEVPRQTLESWLKDDPEFSAALSRARSEGIEALTHRVVANPKGPGGAGWLLERRYREDFGAHTTVTHTIDETQVRTLMEQYGVTETEVRDALAEAAKLLQPPKK